MIRNLLFHCYPLKSNPSFWPWHVDQLLKYKSVWNGRRIVVLVLDHMTDLEPMVREKFAPLEAEIFVRLNHRHLHETTHFLEIFGKLESLREDEATFYAHAKGVSHQRYQTPNVNLPGIERWCRALYQLNLSRPELVDRLLEKYAAVGAFRNVIKHADTTWLYSGTFFWIKHSVIFSRNWLDIFNERFGVEGYPGRHLKLDETFALPPEEITANLLYDGYVTDERILGWQKELEAL